MLLSAHPVLAGEQGGGATKPVLEKPVPAPPPPDAPIIKVEEKTVVQETSKLSELERLLALVRLLRQRLMITSETAFYIGQRHMKILHFTTPLYEIAKKWATLYRRAIIKMLSLSITQFICQPELIVELKDAIEWGKLRAIGEPWYYKKGYRRAQPLLEKGDVPDCLWIEFPPR